MSLRVAWVAIAFRANMPFRLTSEAPDDEAAIPTFPYLWENGIDENHSRVARHAFPEGQGYGRRAGCLTQAAVDRGSAGTPAAGRPRCRPKTAVLASLDERIRWAPQAAQGNQPDQSDLGTGVRAN